MKNEEFVEKLYLNETEGANRRDRALGRWRDRVGEYMHEKGSGGG